MEFIRSHMVRVFVAVFVVLFCGELSYKVRGVRIVQVVNIGDNITLDCNPPRNEYNSNTWYRNSTFFASFYGISIDGNYIHYPRITQTYIPYYTTTKSRYSLAISNTNISDSAIYECFDYNGYALESYDVRVIGCTCSLTQRDNPENEKVICYLKNYRAENQIKMGITINGDMNKNILIDVTGTFSFAMLRHELYNSLQFEFNPYTNATSNIRCMLPAKFTSPPPSTHYPTTSLIPMTPNRRSKASYTTSQELISGESNATIIHHTPQNKYSSPGNNGNSNIPIILGIIGSSFLMIFALIICVLRYGRMKKRNQDIPKQCETNDSEENQTTTDNMMSIEGTSSSRGPSSAMYMELLKENREHVDNIPHDYTYVTPTESARNETSLNHSYAIAEYVNSMVKHQSKRKGASPRPEDQYDDVLAPELGDHPKRKEVSPRPEEQYDDVSVPEFGDD